MAGSSVAKDTANDVATLPATSAMQTSQAAPKLPKLFPLAPLHLVKPDGTVVTTRERIAVIEAEIPRQHQMLENIRHSRQIRVDRLANGLVELERSSARRKEHTENFLKMFRAAVTIQANIRGYIARKLYRKALLAIADKAVEEDVQDERKSMMYVHLKNLRRVIHTMAFSDPVIRDQYAGKIQLWWRRVLHSRRAEVIKLYEAYRAYWKKKMTEAQIRISRWVRRWGQESVSMKMNVRDCTASEKDLELDMAARIVQAVWRSRPPRKVHEERASQPAGGKVRMAPSRKSRATTRVTQGVRETKMMDKKVDIVGTLAPTEVRRDVSVMPLRERADLLPKAKKAAKAAPPASPRKTKAVEKKATKKARVAKPKKALVFFDTQYQEDLKQTVARCRLSENTQGGTACDAASPLSENPIPLTHPLLDSTMLAANPHYITLARSLFH